jgi:hypothetical protein
MLLVRHSPWTPLAAAVTVAAALLAAWLGDRALLHPIPLPALAAPAAFLAPLTPARVCMTRHGMCPIGPVPAGAPCGCPHPLSGSVPGHAERLDGPSFRTGARDWESQETEEAEDPLADLDLLVGP